MTFYKQYLLVGSQCDEISIWNKGTLKLERSMSTDSILRAIAIVRDYVAFVSGSHIWGLKMENVEKL